MKATILASHPLSIQFTSEVDKPGELAALVDNMSRPLVTVEVSDSHGVVVDFKLLSHRIKPIEDNHREQLALLGIQNERAHVAEMKRVAKLAWDAHCDSNAVDFDAWWRDHVQAEDGSGIHIR